MFECPSRGGTRGGKSLFDWENVKADKYRESYLGHSLNAPIGRWQKNKDLRWYTKGGDCDDKNIYGERIRDEIKEAKEKELDMLASMLSNKQNSKMNKGGVSKEEIKSFFKLEQFTDDGFEMKGLGHSRAAWGPQSTLAVKETLEGTTTLAEKNITDEPKKFGICGVVDNLHKYEYKVTKNAETEANQDQYKRKISNKLSDLKKDSEHKHRHSFKHRHKNHKHHSYSKRHSSSKDYLEFKYKHSSRNHPSTNNRKYDRKRDHRPDEIVDSL